MEVQSLLLQDSAGENALPGAVPAKKSYVAFPAKISLEGRQALLHEFPALQYHGHAAVYLRLAEYIIFATYEDKDGRLIVPATHIAEITRGRRVDGKRYYSAISWLEAFSADVWPLQIRDYCHQAGEARSVGRDLPEAVKSILLDEPLDAAEEGQVWFTTGVPVTRKKLYAEAVTYTQSLRELASGVANDHPARALMEYLNSQPQTVIGKIVRSNWSGVIRTFEAMEEGARKDSARTTLLQLRDYCKLIYASSERTPRLYALGPTIHGLPRELRKAALQGCVSLDARSCQLAVVSRLWCVPELEAFLASGQNIWKELIAATGLQADDKPSIKTALYSIVFGMRASEVRKRLAKAVGEGAADAYLAHRIIAELLVARKERLREIRKARHVIDAWGRRIDYHKRDAKLRSLLAQEVQSYEVRLMLSMLPLFESERDLSVVSWLHDGITIWVTDGAQRKRIISRLCQSFAFAAEELHLETALEEE